MHIYNPPLHNGRAKKFFLMLLMAIEGTEKFFLMVSITIEGAERFFLMLSIAIEGAKNFFLELSITIGRAEYVLLLEKFRHEDAIANLSKAGK